MWYENYGQRVRREPTQMSEDEMIKRFMKNHEAVVRTLSTDIKKENENMENLYNVIVVDKHRYIQIDEKVVAKDEESAKFKAGVYDSLVRNVKLPSDVTVFVNRIGSVKVEETPAPTITVTSK